MKRQDAPIRTPCSADWNAMQGDAKSRFCGQCAKDVHNLSEMTEAEARAVVAQPKVCVRYRVDPRTQRIQHRAPQRFMLRVAAAATLSAGLAMPAVASISEDTGEISVLANLWDSLSDLLDGDEDFGEVQGGIEFEPVPETVEELPLDPEDLPMMGGIMREPPPPVVEVELGEVAPPTTP